MSILSLMKDLHRPIPVLSATTATAAVAKTSQETDKKVAAAGAVVVASTATAAAPAAKPETSQTEAQQKIKSAVVFSSREKFIAAVKQGQPKSLVDAGKLYDQILSYSDLLIKLDNVDDRPSFLRSDTTLERSFFRSGKNNWFVLFNKSAQNDTLISRSQKVIRLALNFFTLQWWVSTRMRPKYAKIERLGEKLLIGVPGVLLPLYVFSYVSKKNKEKVRRLAPYYTCLDTLIQRPIESVLQNSLIQQLLELYLHIANKKLICRDIKTKNFVVNEATSTLYMIDFESVCKDDDAKGLKDWKTEGRLMSPEGVYAALHMFTATTIPELERHVEVTADAAYDKWCDVDFTKVNMKALDVWSIGIVSFQVLFNGSNLPWMVNIDDQQSHLRGMLAMYKGVFNESDGSYKKWQYLEDANSDPLEAIIKACLTLDYRQRASAETIKSMLEAMKKSAPASAPLKSHV